MTDIPRLVSAAIIRDGKTHSNGFRSHADIRGMLGDEDAYVSKRSDEEGFLTSNDEFVDRYTAAEIGYRAGQVLDSGVRLLSSEVTWDAVPKPVKKPKRKLYGKQPKRLFRGA